MSGRIKRDPAAPFQYVDVSINSLVVLNAPIDSNVLPSALPTDMWLPREYLSIQN